MLPSNGTALVGGYLVTVLTRQQEVLGLQLPSGMAAGKEQVMDCGVGERGYGLGGGEKGHEAPAHRNLLASGETWCRYAELSY